MKFQEGTVEALRKKKRREEFKRRRRMSKDRRMSWHHSETFNDSLTDKNFRYR